MKDIEEIANLVKNCTDCPLGLSRTNAVPGEGPADAQIMFIAEGPGQHEDAQGRPFVGPAGRFLEQLLELAEINREDVFITNMIKCRAPDNRDPEPEEMKTCSKYLDRQIELINPDLIVTLGRFSMEKFIRGEKISKAHGRLRRKNGLNILPVIHPAAGLRRNEMRQAIEKDFETLPYHLLMARNYPPDEEPDPPEPEKPKKNGSANGNGNLDSPQASLF